VPAAQLAQSAGLVVLGHTWPAAATLQVVCPAVPWCSPATQAMGAEVVVGQRLPTGHWVHAVCPPSE
jgi:hypothetical protein